jgi:hypothetical protein
MLYGDLTNSIIMTIVGIVQLWWIIPTTLIIFIVANIISHRICGKPLLKFLEEKMMKTQ